MLFAERTQWDLESNAITQAIQYLKASSKLTYDLSQSNPTRCGFEYPQDAIFKSWCNEKSLVYDPQSQGLLFAREAVSDYYASKNIRIAPENVFLTSRTSEGYSLLFKLLANPNETILFPKPSYPLFQFLCDINDVEIQYYHLDYRDQWEIAQGALIDEKISAKAFVIVSPNNPTGSIVSRAELNQINEMCKRKNMAIICDEVFMDYMHDSEAAYISLAENEGVLTFTLGGLSKTLAMPQMKLSWIIINGPQKLVEEAKGRLEVIADTYLSVNTPVQHSLRNLLELSSAIQSQINERIQRNLNFLKKSVQTMSNVVALPAKGGWYCVLKIDSLIHEESFVLDLIRNDSVLVHPGYFYDFDEDGHIVLSLIVNSDIFAEGLNRILERSKSL